MWVLMKEIYTGPLGIFLKGNKYDLPADILNKLSKKSYEQTCAPWDEHKDFKAIEKAQVAAKAREARLWANMLQDKADEAKQKTKSLVAEADKKQDEAKKAADESIKAANRAQKKKATAEQTQYAADLVIEAKRKNLIFEKAHAELQVAVAEQELKQLEADNAKAKAEQLAKKAGLPIDKQVDKQIDEQIDKQIDQQIDGIPEGQAVQSG